VTWPDDRKPRSFSSPAAFRQALDVRLRQRATDTHQPFQRVQRTFLYDRFLARLEDGPAPLVVKGGLALELRLHTARSTKDVDLRWPVEPSSVARNRSRSR
jgi:hypothetical protein